MNLLGGPQLSVGFDKDSRIFWVIQPLRNAVVFFEYSEDSTQPLAVKTQSLLFNLKITCTLTHLAMRMQSFRLSCLR